MKPVPLFFGGLVFIAGFAQAKELSPREIYEQISPAVVMVMGYPSHGKQGSGGTGSIIHADGLVLTNAHVVIEEKTGKPYPQLSVFLKPARVTGDSGVDLVHRLKARVVASSSSLDLALLKLEDVAQPLPTVRLGESHRTAIGDRVMAIGHPEQGGLWSLTTGVISAEMDNFNGVKGKHVYQTETGLNRGNSGGPLIDGQGHMIGVNTAIARVAADGLPITNISFSLKSSVAKQWLGEQGAAVLSATSRIGDPSTEPIDQTFESPRKPVIPTPPLQKPNHGDPPMSARPYNLDQLVSERSKAETDLEDMILEMRNRMKTR